MNTFKSSFYRHGAWYVTHSFKRTKHFAVFSKDFSSLRLQPYHGQSAIEPQINSAGDERCCCHHRGFHFNPKHCRVHVTYLTFRVIQGHSNYKCQNYKKRCEGALNRSISQHNSRCCLWRSTNTPFIFNTQRERDLLLLNFVFQTPLPLPLNSSKHRGTHADALLFE